MILNSSFFTLNLIKKMISKNQSIQDFLNRTASNEPIPGGGSVSALNGAIATPLAEMLANLSIGKKKYVELEDEMKQVDYSRFLATWVSRTFFCTVMAANKLNTKAIA